jgi:hypothetical protein
MTELSKNTQVPQCDKTAVIRRFVFVILAPIWALNLIFATIMLIPYYILTNKWFFDTKFFKGFVDWHLNLSYPKNGL